MPFFSSFFKQRRSRSTEDPVSEQLKQEEPDQTKWDDRWHLLYEKLVKIFQGRHYDNAHDLAMEVILILMVKGYEIGDRNTFFVALKITEYVQKNEHRRRQRQ